MSPRSARSLLRRRSTWLLGLPLVLVVLVVGGTWVYLNVLRDDPPPRLTIEDAIGNEGATTTEPTADAPDATAGIDGTWALTDGSQAGYRVQEVLFGQDAEAVGRTEEVTGTLEASGTSITATSVEVDMASVTSDESRRDGQFRGRIMSTDQFPTATFVLTSPIELGSLPSDGEQVEVTAVGQLTLRGVTRAVELPLTAALDDGRIVVSGAIEVDFDEFEIPDASGGPASVGRTGELELLLVFGRAG
jgi:polyisoprenoid-binding protein YceI